MQAGLPESAWQSHPIEVRPNPAPGGQRVGCRLLHHALKCSLEARHLIVRANSDADMRGECGSDSSNIDVLARHAVDDFFCWALRIEHETIGLRGNVGIAMLVEPVKRVLPDRAVDALALGDEAGISQAGGSRGYRGNRHRVQI